MDEFKNKKKEYNKKWYFENKNRITKKNKEKWAEYRNKNRIIINEKALKYRKILKQKVFDHYGNKCNCPECQENNPLFLTIDHVNNDGNKHMGVNTKKRIAGEYLYRMIIKENFPDKYQILCMNCNFGKRMNKGICPHNNK